MNPIANQNKKKILYVDMDNVLVDFPSAFEKLNKEVLNSFEDKDDIPGVFSLMEPVEGAIEAFKSLSVVYDTYILSTSPWNNPTAWSDKLEWVKKYFGDVAHKRLILTHHKNLNKGDYLIDDRTKNGASEFEGELIQFGSEQFPNWINVLKYLLPLRQFKVTSQPLVGSSASKEYFVEAVGEEEAKDLALLKLINKETDGILLDSPGQILICEEIKKEIYIKCKKCGTEVHFETRGSLTPCKCGAISVDGSKNLVRVLGNPEDYEEIQK